MVDEGKGGNVSVMSPRPWKLLGGLLGRIGVVAGALVVMILLAGGVEAHPLGAGGPGPAAAEDAPAEPGAARVACPHGTGHLHDLECCPGAGCAPALVPAPTLPLDHRAGRSGAPRSAPALAVASPEGRFRPPRARHAA
jgi:hypothetical protein